MRVNREGNSTGRYRSASQSELNGLWPVLVAAVTVLGTGIALLWGVGPIADETVHFEQILQLRDGRGAHADLTTLPVLHLLLALPARWLAPSRLELFRIAIAVSALATILAFHYLVQRRLPERAFERTLQLLLLPVFVSCAVLLYTDVPSLLFLLLGVVSISVGRPSLGAAAGFLAVLIRQNAIVWFGYLALLFLGGSVTGAAPAARREEWRNAGVRIRSHSLAAALFVAGVIGFAVWVAVRGGVAIGDAWAHPFPYAGVGNLVFFAFFLAVAYLPLHLEALGDAIRQRRRGRRILIALAALGVIFAGFAVDHPYNQHVAEHPSWSVRNIILAWSTSGGWATVAFFLVAALGVAGLVAAEPRDGPAAVGWLPFTVLALVPSWLIEQRYYLVPLAFWLFCRPAASLRTERISVAWAALLSLAVLLALRSGKYYL